MSNLSCTLCRNISAQFNYTIFKNARQLYSLSSLKIPIFMENKQRMKNSLTDIASHLKRLKEISNPSKKALVFSDDIRKMLYLASSEEHLNVLSNLIKKIVAQDKLLERGYDFSIDLMRFYFVINKSKEAYEIYKSCQNSARFQHPLTLVILNESLFKNGFYSEIVELNSDKNLKCLTLYYFAACYKLNTRESFELALKKFQSPDKKSVRALLFFSVLAINQKEVEYAIEAFSYNYFYVFNNVQENIKCLAYALVHRLEDVIERIKEVLESNNRSSFFLTKDVADRIETEAKSHGGKLAEDFLNLKKSLLDINCIRDVLLDSLLCEDKDLGAYNVPRTKARAMTQAV